MAPKKTKKSNPGPDTVAGMKRDLAESDALRDKMTVILRNTADALHGGPLDDGYWSWHDLAEIAATLYEDNHNLQAALSSKEGIIQSLLLYVRTRDDAVNPKKDSAFAAHVETCMKIGLTPMTPEVFAAEDRRIMLDWQRRRNGLEDTLGGVGAQGPPVFGSYGGCVRPLPARKSAWTRFWIGFKDGFMRPFRRAKWGKY
jgi:hypothetical protein